jgi:hypothetical protein
LLACKVLILRWCFFELPLQKVDLGSIFASSFSGEIVKQLYRAEAQSRKAAYRRGQSLRHPKTASTETASTENCGGRVFQRTVKPVDPVCCIQLRPVSGLKSRYFGKSWGVEYLAHSRVGTGRWRWRPGCGSSLRIAGDYEQPSSLPNANRPLSVRPK